MRLFAVLATVACAAPAWAGEGDDAGALPRSGFSLKLSVGPAVRRVFKVDTVAGEASLMLGGTSRSGPGRGIAVYGGLGGLYGRTTGGLTTYTVRLGGSAEAVVERLRVGGNLWISSVAFQRASGVGTLGAPGVGLQAFVTYDVLELDGGSSLFVMPTLSADLYSGTRNGGPVMVGGGLALGYRS